MDKLKVIIVCNCQVRALEEALLLSKNSSDRFVFEQYAPVHVIKIEDVAVQHELLKSCRLLLAQTVTENYRNSIGLGTETLKSHLPNDATILSQPSIYWSGYNRNLLYLKNSFGVSVSKDFDYHHRPIFSGYLNSHSVATVFDAINNPESFVATADAAHKALRDLATRESKLDLKVSSFIEGHYQPQRLFWTFNHPSQFVIIYLARQILKALNLEDDFPTTPPKEPQSNTICPILPAVRLALNLHFPAENFFRIRLKNLSLPTAIGEYFNFYDKNPELVKSNISVLDLQLIN